MSKTLHIKADNSNVKLDVDLIYPVGSIYMSVNSTSPATLFGGTWEQIKDTFLLGSGSYTLGATGGEKNHTLTVNEMPSHGHIEKIGTSYGSDLYRVSNTSGSNAGAALVGSGISNGADAIKTYSTGGSQSHNNMPPYLVVNIWTRTA